MSATNYTRTSRDPDLALPYPPRRGPSRDAAGCPRQGVYLQIFSRRIAKRYIRNGNVLATFRYPVTTRTFSSPQLNDYNQHLCGAWYWNWREDGSLRAGNEHNNEIIIERVKNGKKPLGCVTLFTDDENSGDWLQQLTATGLNVRVDQQGIRTRLTFCRSGKMKELFDLDQLFADYCAFEAAAASPVFSRGQLHTQVRQMAAKNLEDFLAFDHLTPSTPADLLITGLILGYPIENTYAVITE